MLEVSSHNRKICRDCHREYDDSTLSSCPADGAPLILVQSHDSLIGRTIDGRFEVLRIIGTGGMGNVYLAQQKSVGRLVAIKFLQADLTHDHNAVKRFLKEAKALSQLTHPNAVTFHDFGQDPSGLLYLVMEYVHGATLNATLERAGTLPVETACRVMIQLCDALGAAHHLGIVHRDLKPSNIMLARQPDGKVMLKVLDFGLAKLAADDNPVVTRSGVVAGTPRYMSPEQLLGKRIDKRTDIYSAGVLLYEMLSGRPPFLGETAASLAIDHVQKSPPPLVKPGASSEIPLALEQLTLRCLAKRPDDRPSSAGQLRSELRDVLVQIASTRGEATVISTTIEDGVLPPLDAAVPRAPLSATHDAAPLRDSGSGETASQMTMPETPKAKGSPSGEPAAYPARPRSAWLVTALLIVVLLALVIFFVYRRGRSAADDEPQSPLPAPTESNRPLRRGPAPESRVMSLTRELPAPLAPTAPTADSKRTEAPQPTSNGLRVRAPLGETRRPSMEPRRLPVVDPGERKTTRETGPTPHRVERDKPRRNAPAIVLRILSQPSGASVYLGRQHLGRTPVAWHTAASSRLAVVTLRKAGYKEIRVRIAPRHSRVYKFTLSKQPGPVRKGDPIFQLLKKR